MDADFSHDPAHLPAMIAAAADSDLVLGSRYVRGGADRRLAAAAPAAEPQRLASTRARILGVRVNDLTSGFRCVRRRVLETVEPSTLRSQGYVFNIELTYRALLAGFTVAEVPICFRDREAGESKMSLPIAFEALMLVPRLRRESREWRTEETAGGRGAGSAGASSAGRTAPTTRASTRPRRRIHAGQATRPRSVQLRRQATD